MIRNLPVDPARIALVATGAVEPVVDWIERDGRRQPGDQTRDVTSNQPLWQVHCLAVGGDRPEVVAVRMPAPTCPEPEAFAPVAFERLDVRVSVNRSTGVLSGYWSAAGIADSRARTGKPQDATAAA